MIIIKSQCGESIGKYVEVKVDENIIKGISVMGSMTVLGTYASRERAMKILEVINFRIVQGTVKDYLDGKYRVKQDIVYPMPSK